MSKKTTSGLCLLIAITPSGTLAPVSYTHLDVYKRQLYRTLMSVVVSNRLYIAISSIDPL